jgi:tight adherence protein C
MNLLSQSLTSFLADPSRAGWVFAFAVGATFTLMVWAAALASAARSSPLRRRLDALSDGGPAAPQGRLSKLISRLRPYLSPKEETTRRGLQERLMQAGLRSGHALSNLYACKALLAIALPAALVAGAWLYPNPRMTAGAVLALIVLLGAAGWLLPNLYVRHRLNDRRHELLNALPDALDLLVACTEAGLGLNAAMERVAEQMPANNSELAMELQLVNAEIRAGVDRTIALRNLADRTGLEDIRGLVALITHSMRFGTGIAETLRVYAEEFRDRRMQRAEAAAAVVGTKLIFPLCFCIFPAFFVVATGPAIVGVLRVLSAGDVEWPSSE